MGMDAYLIPKPEDKSVEEVLKTFNYCAYWRNDHDTHHTLMASGVPIPSKLGEGWENSWFVERSDLETLLHEYIDDLVKEINLMHSVEEEFTEDDFDYEKKKLALDGLLKGLKASNAKKFIYYASY